jgi:hypothetical protein
MSASETGASGQQSGIIRPCVMVVELQEPLRRE